MRWFGHGTAPADRPVHWVAGHLSASRRNRALSTVDPGLVTCGYCRGKLSGVDDTTGSGSGSVLYRVADRVSLWVAVAALVVCVAGLVTGWDHAVDIAAVLLGLWLIAVVVAGVEYWRARQ
ncbi:MAG: hypothetical protein ACRDTZ_00085 [Pseudonocardiaceae bacterium]